MEPHSETMRTFFSDYSQRDGTADFSQRSRVGEYTIPRTNTNMHDFVPQVDRFQTHMHSSSDGLKGLRPDYHEQRGWSETLPGRNVPLNMTLRWNEDVYNQINKAPSSVVRNIPKEPHNFYKWDRSEVGRRTTTVNDENVLRSAMLIQDRPYTTPSFGTLAQHPKHVQTTYQYKTQVEDGQPVKYRDGIQRVRDHYRMQESMHAVPKLYRSLEPLYRFPDALQNKEALETGRKWQKMAHSDGRNHKEFGGSILPRLYGKAYSSTGEWFPWKYQSVQPEVFPSYERFEKDNPDWSGGRHLHSLKYSNLLDRCRACPILSV